MKKKKPKFSRSGASSGALGPRPSSPPLPPASTAQAALATLAAAFDDWVDDAGLVSADGGAPGPVSMAELAVDLADDRGEEPVEEPADEHGVISFEIVLPPASDRRQTGVDDEPEGDDSHGAAEAAMFRPATDPALILFTTGTPSGGWQAEAESLLAAAPPGIDLRHSGFAAWHAALPVAADGSIAQVPVGARTALARLGPAHGDSWGGVDERAVWVLDALAEAHPQARFLFFVASPAAALAAWLASPADSGTPELQLAVWRAGAERLLRHAQRHAGRCLLVNENEAASRPAALAALCAEVLGVPFAAGPTQRPRRADSLAAALAVSLAAADRRATALFAELDAACTPLTDEEGVADADAFDAAEAARQFRFMAAEAGAAVALRSLAQQAQGEVAEFGQRALSAELRALEAAAAADQQALDAQREAERQSAEWRLAAELQATQYRAEQTALVQRLGAASLEVEQLLRQLHQVQEEFESVELKARDTELRLGEAERQRGDEQLRNRTQLDALGAEKARLEAGSEALARLAAERLAQINLLIQEKARVGSERELVAAQVAELQGTADALVNDKVRLTGERDLASARAHERQGLVDAMTKEKVRLTGERDTATKRLAERQVLIDGLTKDKVRLAGERDAAVVAARERQGLLEALTKDKASLTDERNLAVAQVTGLQVLVDALTNDKRSLANDCDTLLAQGIELKGLVDASMEKERHWADERELAVMQLAELQSMVDALTTHKIAVTGERDLAVAQVIELQGLARTLADEKLQIAGEREWAVKQLAAAQAMGDALAKDKHSLVGERDAASKEMAERKSAAELLAAEKTRLVGERDAVRRQNVSLSQELEVARAQQGVAPAQMEALRQENEMLLHNLHEVQEEMERYYLELQHLASAPAAATVQAPKGLTVGRVSHGRPRETPPHLELELLFQDLNFGPGEDLSEVRLRLVEHHGKPGLTIFAGRSPQGLLARWHQTGDEDGAGYMLLVPGDDNALPLLQALSPSDWWRLNELAALLAHQLPSEAPSLGPLWPGVAVRLQRQLAELPAVFRYREVELAAAPLGALDIRFSEVEYGVRALPSLQLLWPAAGHDAIVLRLSDAGAIAPPLMAWPLDDAGAPQQVLSLSVSGGSADSAAWAALPAPDREFVLSLLTRLVSVFGDAALLPVGSDGAALAAHANALLKAARAAIAPDSGTPRVRRLVRSLLGRARASS